LLSNITIPQDLREPIHKEEMEYAMNLVFAIRCDFSNNERVFSVSIVAMLYA
jgi:hypothetical protein